MSAAVLEDEHTGSRNERRQVSLRVPEPALDLLDRAAERMRQDRATFVLTAAVEKANEVLRDQTVFPLSEEDYDRFVAVLDDPPPPNDRLKALLRQKPVWEKS